MESETTEDDSSLELLDITDVEKKEDEEMNTADGV